MWRWWSRALVVAAGVVAACGGAANENARKGERPPDVVLEVFFGGGHRPAKFDPASPDPRVRKAYAQLTELVGGRAIQFRFDEAVIPKWEADFDTLFARCIEAVTADLAQLARETPALFKRAAAELRVIAVDYDAALGRDWASELTKSREGATVRIALGPNAYSLVPARAVSHAFRVAFVEELDATFKNASPDDLALDMLSAYVDWLARGRGDAPAKEGRQSDAERALGEPVFARAQKILRAASRAKQKGAKEAQADARSWLIGTAVDAFREVYAAHPDAAKTAPAQAPFKNTEAAFVAWLISDLDAFSDAQKADIAQKLFVTRRGGEHRRPARKQRERFVESAWPGFDIVAFALRVFGDWAKSGHPAPPVNASSPDDKRQAFVDFVVCPHTRAKDGSYERSRMDCRDDDFYAYALDRPEARARFVQHLGAARDPDLATQVILNQRRGGDLASVLEYWRAFEGHDPSWRAATRVVGEELGRGLDARDGLYDALVKAWRKEPSSSARRGVLLYAIVQLDEESGSEGGYQRIDWEHLAEALGGPIDAAELGGYFDEGPRAFARAHRLWPALGRFSRADVLVSRLEKYVTQATAPEAARVLRRIVERVCQESSRWSPPKEEEETGPRTRKKGAGPPRVLPQNASADGDLSKLNTQFKKRASAGGDAARAFDLLVDDTGPKGRCP